MGYYTNALLLMAAPEGERVASLFEKGAKVVVYRHVTEPLWLVDAHVPGRREHWPFQGRLPFAREGRAELPDPSESLADAYFAVHQSLAAYAGRHVASLVHDAAHAARVCGQDVVLILGDDEGNDASCRVLEKLGMLNEGIRRRHVRKGKKLHDVSLWGLLHYEWRDRR